MIVKQKFPIVAQACYRSVQTLDATGFGEVPVPSDVSVICGTKCKISGALVLGLQENRLNSVVNPHCLMASVGNGRVGTESDDGIVISGNDSLC